MAKPLDQLTDAELQEALRRLADLTAKTQREAVANPGPGWEPVIDRLNEGWDKLDGEFARRHGHSSKQQADVAGS